MENLFDLLPFMLCALIGSMVHIIGKFAELEKTRRKLNPYNWFKKHFWRTLLGFCLSVGGVIVLAESSEISYAASLLMGYTGDSLMKKGMKK